jgi:phage replication-related protein YjqB (UPF0714/DUF867 family)
MTTPEAKLYKGFADLAKHQVRGKDYEIVVLSRPASQVAVIAPHGGDIEPGTSQIARAIAADDCHLYLFEGIRPSNNYATLHLTSHLFDEPECLAIVGQCPIVIAIHGCKGIEESVFIGGRNIALKNHLAAAIRGVDVTAETDGHAFPAMDITNICNRGITGAGIQLEFSAALRGVAAEKRVVSAIRSVLVSVNTAAHFSSQSKPRKPVTSTFNAI